MTQAKWNYTSFLRPRCKDVLDNVLFMQLYAQMYNKHHQIKTIIKDT